MTKKISLLFLIFVWSIFYVSANIPTVLSTPEHVVFSHVNKVTKLYSLNSDYKNILLRTKSAIAGRECYTKDNEQYCDVKVKFIGPHTIDSTKWVQYNITAQLKQTKHFGWIFDKPLDQREILKVSGTVPASEALTLPDTIDNQHDNYFWGISFVISWLISPLLFVFFVATLLMSKKMTVATTFGLVQLLLATYLNTYISGYHFHEFEIYQQIIGA
ncbi:MULTISPECIES: hypothetical protein [Vibrio]|uniref:hypothetical protein n=1 Tax=Vibrio TaxID=662 RepID=UPI00078D822E|nr:MULTISPECIES: hypothetical protein [Vibrio]BAU70831.1 hypothetical protein [Vibrio sp. 04Ya108]BBM67600.1 hypothetical protein VA249_42460 [Vibrio alfacsensis]BCN27083.1 hypothetical protein VYA_42750 [Vibrio alfacsensis]